MFVCTEAYNTESNGTLKVCQFVPMTESKDKAIIMTMKSKSCEIDPIPTHIFKQLLPSILPTVTTIVSLSLGEGVFCNKWKRCSCVTTAEEGGARTNQIKLQTCKQSHVYVQKIEKCVLHQLNIHCETYNLLPDYQLAYHENYSCKTYLL